MVGLCSINQKLSFAKRGNFMRNMETITTSCHGESLGISLRIGSMGVTFAGNVAWI